MIAAIHQPNFFPWLGYFRKIARADVFIFLDDVQFSRGSWINRVRLLVAGQARWVTCPIRDAGAMLAIDATMIDDSKPWRQKLLRTIEANYRRREHFDAVYPLVGDLVRAEYANLADFNIAAIQEIAKRLGLAARFARSSAMRADLSAEDPASPSGSDLLAMLCRTVGADVYLAGDGAATYETPEAYESRGIALTHNKFAAPSYPQVPGSDFVPGLSILDALFCLGLEGTGALVAGT